MKIYNKAHKYVTTLTLVRSSVPRLGCAQYRLHSDVGMWKEGWACSVADNVSADMLIDQAIGAGLLMGHCGDYYGI